MKRNLYLLAMLCLSAPFWGQTDEGNSQKGMLLDNPAMTAPDAYETVSTVYSTGRDNDQWKSRNWQAGTSNSGIWYATGTYDGNTHYSLEGPGIELPPLAGASERYNLYIEEQYQLESYYDQGLIMISTDQGLTWQTISSRTGQSSRRKSVINLTAYAGRTIWLAFVLEADATHHYQGWSIGRASIKHELLTTGSNAAAGTLRSTAATSLSGYMNAPDAQKFPRFIFANLSVEDANGDFVAGLDESNFSVTEEIQSVVKTVDKDATFKVFSSEDSTSQRPVDILFLMDNSGSMYDNQQAVAANVEAFVNELDNRGFDYRLGLCRFGQSANQGKPIFHNNAGWYTDPQIFVNMWNTINTIDGAREPSWDALYYSAQEYGFAAGAQKVFILITDEAITGNNINYSEITDRQVVIDQLVNKGVKTYAVTEYYSPFDEDFGVIATATGGQWYNIRLPFTDILDDIETEVSNTYTLRYTPVSMDMDGLQRNVTVKVDYSGEQLDLLGSYVPGIAPIVIRTDTTLALHRGAQEQRKKVLIEVLVKDHIPPYTQSVSLFYRNTNPALNVPYTRISMGSTQAGNSESVWRATIPVGDVDAPGIKYYVQASDGSNTTTAPEFLNQDGYPWSFAVWPNLPPEVSNQTDVSSLSEGDVIPFRVKATDNTNNVANVWVYVFRQNKDITFRAYPMTYLGNDIYGYDGITLDDGITEYFFVAEDDFGISAFEGDELAPFVIVDSPWDNPTSPRRHTIFFNQPNGSLPHVEGIEVGDIIGVFYNELTYDAQGNPVITQKCGGYASYTGMSGNSLFANGDDPGTPEKEGFASGEAFAFKVQKKNTGDILSLNHSVSSSSPTTFILRGRSYLDSLKVVTQTQRMVLKKGINLWSTYLIPDKSGFDDMMAPYLSSIVEIYDDEFNWWSPNNTTSTLTGYVQGYGYELYTNGETIIRVTGKKPDIGSLSVDIKGNQEGSLVGCHYDAPENVEAAFSQVASNVFAVDKYINDGTGYAFVESYSPIYGFNHWTDKNMNPGEAYYVFADNAISGFHFPAPTGVYTSSLMKSAEVNPLPQRVISVRHYMHVILPIEAWATTPHPGDEMRAYNESGMLVGRASVLAAGAIVIVDGTNIEQDEVFSLRLWSSVTGTEQPVNVTQWAVGSGRYDNLKVAVAGRFEVDAPAATLSGSISVSPNPAREQVMVSFQLDEGGTVGLSLINVLGSTVHATAPVEYPAGANTSTLDVSGLGKGIYFLNLQAGTNTEIVKLVIE